MSRAVTLLGMGELQKMVCALCAVETFSKLSSAVTNMNSFWRHSVYTGLAAQILAKHANILHPERLFVAGVMNIWWVGIISAVVLFEKIAPKGWWLDRVAGILLIAWGGLMLIAR